MTHTALTPVFVGLRTGLHVVFVALTVLVIVRAIVAPTPSSLAVIGRYVFTPEIFEALDRIEPGRGGELQLTDAIDLLNQDQTVYGQVFTDGRFDIGQKVDFLRANIELALDRDDLRPETERFLVEALRRRGII